MGKVFLNFVHSQFRWHFVHKAFFWTMTWLFLVCVFAHGRAFGAEGRKLLSKRNWSYIDSHGNPQCGGNYTYCSRFSEGAALVRKKERSFFIDSWGNELFTVTVNDADPLVIEPRPFHEGFSAVWTPEGTGFVDKAGRFVIAPKFLMVEDFSEGLAPVSTDVNKWGYIDKSGRFVIEPQFTAAHKFSQGVAAVEVGSLWGYIDHKGKFALSPRYEFAGSFREGLAPVISEHGCYSFVDLNGNTPIKRQFECASEFKNGLALVRLAVSRLTETAQPSRYMDHKGKVIDLNGLECYGEGMLPFRDEYNNVGFATGNGDKVIPARFQETGGFSEGLASVLLDGKWGYIDKTGKVVIPAIYDAAYPFSCGRAVVATDEPPEFRVLPPPHHL